MIRLPLRLRLLLTLRSVGRVLRRPAYLALAAVGAFLTFQLLMWFFNLNLMIYMLFQAHLPLGERLLFPFRSFAGLFTNFTSLQAVTLVVLALLQGVIIAMLVYVFRRRLFTATAASTGGVSLVVAVFGFGCATCGTSLLSPLVSALAAGSAAGVGALLGPIINLLSIALALVALVQLAAPLSSELAKEEQVAGVL